MPTSVVAQAVVKCGGSHGLRAEVLPEEAAVTQDDAVIAVPGNRWAVIVCKFPRRALPEALNFVVRSTPVLSASA